MLACVAMYKKLVVMVVFLAGCMSYVSAETRNLPGVKIVTRAQWWANEAWRYATTSKTERDALRAEQKEAQMKQLLETDTDRYLTLKQQEYQATTATEYLIDVTPTEQTVEEYRETSDGNYLKRPESVHLKKNKIIIHHTAGDYTDILTWWTWAAIQQLQDIYKYHTLTNWRWDIGYNFVIDPFGTIYEGRAGWAWVVWAHVSRNNTPTVGISLMGNFNTNVPTDASLKSLVALTTALSRKYAIDPKSTVTYFKSSSEDPFLKTYTNYALAWHTDAWITSCPGTNLYNLLPDIRDQVSENLSKIRLVSLPTVTPKKTAIDKWIALADWYYSDATTVTLSLPIRWSGVDSCTSLDTSVIIHSCSSNNGQLIITLEKSWMSWIKTFSAQTDAGTKKFSFMLIWNNDFSDIASAAKQSYTSRKSIVPTSASFDKITSKLYSSDIQTLIQTPVNVLLYDLSINYPRYEISCDGWCSIRADGVVYSEPNSIVEVNDGFIYLNIPSLEQPLSPQLLEITSSAHGLVHVNNYNRKSYGGTPRNTFRWSLIWKKEQIKNLTLWSYVDQAVVINNVSFDEYMQGIAETSDADNIVKQKIILLLAKMYALFYINGENTHPSIPAGASYQAIDNPDMFQKYVWAWREKTSKMSAKLLTAIQDTVVLYDWYVPILPYFSCSAGFTRSAKEKRWRNDTPYLQSKLDFWACFDFSGHGVWLSGKWSQYLAEKWWTVEQILQYYYPGVEVESITN